jgi:hypothetical protein
VQHRLLGTITERDVLEADAPLDLPQAPCVGAIAHVGLEIEDVKNAIDGCQRVVQHRIHLADAVDRKV